MSGDETCDVVVIGAGPAGLAAAQATAAHGLSTRLIDEQPGVGGQIWRNAAHVLRQGGPMAKSFGTAATAALANLDHANVKHAASATVLDVTLADASDVCVTWLSAVSGQRVMRTTTARALIIATGAQERPLLFPGATLPGVMGVGAVQSVLKQSGLVPGGDGVVLAGQGPLLLLTLSQILEHGGRVSAVLDLQRSSSMTAASGLVPALIGDPSLMAQGAGLMWRARRSGVPWYRNISDLRAIGDATIEQVEFASRGKTHRLPCTLLAVHDGVIPNTQLTRLLALEHEWNAQQQAFVPCVTPHGQSSAPSVWIAGDGAGIAGVGVAERRGRLAGIDVARALGALDQLGLRRAGDTLLAEIERRVPARALVERMFAPLPVTAFAPPDQAEDVILCRCEAVSVARVRAAISDGAAGPNRVKTFTRCGMGACQGRVCGNSLTRIIAQDTGRTPQETGALRIRAPLKPTLISDYLTTDDSNP